MACVQRQPLGTARPAPRHGSGTARTYFLNSSSMTSFCLPCFFASDARRWESMVLPILPPYCMHTQRRSTGEQAQKLHAPAQPAAGAGASRVVARTEKLIPSFFPVAIMLGSIDFTRCAGVAAWNTSVVTPVPPDRATQYTWCGRGSTNKPHTTGLTAELLGVVLHLVYAFLGQAGVEEERQPLDVRLHAHRGPHCLESFLETALAHEAPGSDLRVWYRAGGKHVVRQARRRGKHLPAMASTGSNTAPHAAPRRGATCRRQRTVSLTILMFTRVPRAGGTHKPTHIVAGGGGGQWVVVVGGGGAVVTAVFVAFAHTARASVIGARSASYLLQPPW